jgi:hypothetical protein
MTAKEAIELTPKALHSSLLSQLLGCIELSSKVEEPKRSEQVAEMAHLIAKEVYGQAREIKNDQTKSLDLEKI